MNKRMAEIRKRLNSITGTEWMSFPFNPNIEDPLIVCKENGMYIAQTSFKGLRSTTSHNVVEDTIFIANAPQDVRYLLDKLGEKYDLMLEIIGLCNHVFKLAESLCGGVNSCTDCEIQEECLEGIWAELREVAKGINERVEV